MTILRQDLRQALRALRRSPGFTLAALAILTLGIGIQTTAFSLLDAVALRSLPAVARPGELLDLRANAFSYPTFIDLKQESAGVFSGVAAWGNRSFDAVTASGARRLRGAVVAGDYFGVLGVGAQEGRLLLPADELSGEPIAVVSDRLWRRQLGASASAVGSAVAVNGVPFTIVGIAPEGFRGVGFGQATDLWIPIGSFRLAATGPLARMDFRRRGWSWLSAFGRLKPGISTSAAAAVINAAAKRQIAAYPDSVPEDFRVSLAPLSATAGGSTNAAQPARLLALLCGAVGIVLLVTCANLANLLLMRALGRRQEIGVRLALGAGRGRISRQLLTESLLLAALGGAGGVAVASWAVSLALSVPLPGGTTLADFAPVFDLRALAVAVAASVITGVMFGMVPALQAARTDLLSALQRRPARAFRRWSLDAALVSSQVALCLVLLIGAGLFVRSLGKALATDPGFEPRRVASASVQLGLARYNTLRALQVASDLEATVAALPGVRSTAWASLLPLSGEYSIETISLDRAPDEQLTVDVSSVGAGYFRTLGLPIVQGREFADSLDRPADMPNAIVINEAAARRFWPGENPLGRRLRFGDAEASVVGVSADSLFRSISEKHVPLVYVPIRQLGGDAILSEMTLLARCDGDPSALAGPIAAEVARRDPTLPVFGDRTLRETVEGSLLPQRVGGTLLALFAALTLALAAVGIYGVVAASAARRSREIALRVALGAAPARLRWSLLRRSAATVAVGLAVGLALAFLAAPLAARFLFEVTPHDATTFAAAALLLAGSALLASDLPARRALRLDPMQILRSE